jgi:hypothetical protein
MPIVEATSGTQEEQDARGLGKALEELVFPDPETCDFCEGLRGVPVDIGGRGVM